MIYRLQRRFITVSAVSLVAVVLIVFALMTVFNVTSSNRRLDVLADRVSMGGGRFPEWENDAPPPKPEGNAPFGDFDFITSETPFSTRYFTVWMNVDGEVYKIDTEFIHAVSDERAVSMAKKIVGGRERGWLSSYRYKVFATDEGKAAVFIDGSFSRSSLFQSIAISGAVLFGCASAVIILIILLSKRVVKPIAESYEKQRQFVTDANHELKTPLTLILANLDIAEMELGENEWLQDIRSEGHRMTELVDRLVSLSRMDEEGEKFEFCELELSGIVADTVSDFCGVAEARGMTFTVDIADGILCSGDEMLIRRMVASLLDNAVKYCDAGGEIKVTLEKRRHTVLTVENTYAEVGDIQLDRLFDRFYRADKSRGVKSGYGIGLSLVKAIAEKHRGDIAAYKKDSEHIGFKVTLFT